MVAAQIPPATALELTPHSEKATLIHWGVHQGEDTKSLLAQGGWRGKDEAMPLKYARALGTLSTSLTKRIFKKVQGGWEPPVVLKFQVGELDKIAPVKPGVLGLRKAKKQREASAGFARKLR